VRDRYAQATQKPAQQWPVENTRYEKLYLDAGKMSLSRTAPSASGEAVYDPLDQKGEAVFEMKFEAETELVGHTKLKLWVSTEAGDDLDLHVAIEKLKTDGGKEGFAHWAVYEDAPAAFGWLRVSRRALDQKRSTEYQPVLANKRDDKLAPGEVAEVDIEILPSGTRFFAGEALRLIIKGRDIYTPPKPMFYSRHEDSVNSGAHHIHTGGARASYLLVPVVKL
jgi:predicted acyl esterase